MTSGTGDFELTTEELRIVARFAVESAERVLPLFEHVAPGDPRPRAAVEAAWVFANGAPRTKLQRVASLNAHRAAAEVGAPAARSAARAAGDAAAAAYLHPLARASQVGHILRASANAARAAELDEGDDPDVGDRWIRQARQDAAPALIDVLRRYPPLAPGTSRVPCLMQKLDSSLRMS